MISRCSSPIPEISVCAVSRLTLTRKDGSSLRELGQRLAQPVLVGLGLGLDRDLDDRIGKFDRLEHDRMRRVAQRIAGGGVAQPDRADVAGEDFGNLLALVGVHLDQPADALALLLGRVEHRRPALQPSRVDAQEGQRADVRVGHDLERERAERRVVARPALFHLVADLAHHRRHVERRGQIVDHRVEHRLHALVAERRAHQHRHHLDLERGERGCALRICLRRRLSLPSR